jgi:hemerythrin-like domain-containing protein
MPDPTTALLLDTHDRLRERFALHQEALLDLDLPMALRFLEDHAALLRLHIREEETVLIPVYARRAGDLPGGSVNQFLSEHRHLERTLEELRNDVALLRLDQDDLRRRVIAILDRESMYKHLLDHHDRRERNILYPALDRITSGEERNRLLAGCYTLNQL